MNIGETVTHPQYGAGTITALFRNGQEWMVRFDSGLRFRRPRREFEGQQETMSTAPTALTPTLNALKEVNGAAQLHFKPMTPDQFSARSLIEALRVGVAPAQHIRELTIGLGDEQKRLAAGLNQAHSQGGAAFAVIGDYGFGKSHIVELTAREALDRNFLVAAISLDLQELPPHRSFSIYAGLMHSLRYPDTDERGMGPLLQRAAERPAIAEQMRDLTGESMDPLQFGLQALSNTNATRQQQAWTEWLMGGRRVTTMNRAMPRGVKFPSIYKVGHNERQIAYLLNGVSVLARLSGYSGLAILLDEAESYSLLHAYQRPKAGRFFSAVIYSALQARQNQIDPDEFRQHRYRAYPLAYTAKQSLFFLFTITRSDNQMPLDEWLTVEQILDLEPHQTPQEIGHFLERVMGYHAQAYGYEIGERQRQIRRGAAEHVALGMRNARLSIRGAVRLGVELFDLLYLYPEYETALLLDELRNTVR
ncbi:MAG: DUF2791 family P-loop domain-containing protein [Caldilineaceae bacterium]